MADASNHWTPEEDALFRSMTDVPSMMDLFRIRGANRSINCRSTSIELTLIPIFSLK